MEDREWEIVEPRLPISYFYIFYVSFASHVYLFPIHDQNAMLEMD